MVKSVTCHRGNIYTVRSKLGSAGNDILTLITTWKLTSGGLQMISGERSRHGKRYRASISPVICREAFGAVWKYIRAADNKHAERKQPTLDFQSKGSTSR